MELNKEYFQQIISFYEWRSEIYLDIQKIKLLKEKKVNNNLKIYYYHFIQGSIVIDFKLIINTKLKKTRIVERLRHIKTIFHFKDKKLHGYPAIVEKNSSDILSSYCYKKGLLHNEQEAAINKGSIKEYWINGRQYPEKNEFQLFKMETKVKNF